jgi:hypothetical protein
MGGGEGEAGGDPRVDQLTLERVRLERFLPPENISQSVSQSPLMLVVRPPRVCMVLYSAERPSVQAPLPPLMGAQCIHGQRYYPSPRWYCNGLLYAAPGHLVCRRGGPLTTAVTLMMHTLMMRRSSDHQLSTMAVSVFEPA